MVTVGRINDGHVVKPAAGSTGIKTAKIVTSMRPLQNSGHGLPADGYDVRTEFASGVRVTGHPHAQRNREHGGQQNGADGKGDGVRESAEDNVHGRRLERVRRAEIQVDEVPQVDQVWENTDLSKPMSARICARSSVLARGPARA